MDTLDSIEYLLQMTRWDTMDTLDLIEYLLQMTSLPTHADVIEGEVQVEDVHKVRVDAEAGLAMINEIKDCIDNELSRDETD